MGWHCPLDPSDYGNKNLKVSGPACTTTPAKEIGELKAIFSGERVGGQKTLAVRDACASLKIQADVAEGLRKTLSATALYISGKVAELDESNSVNACPLDLSHSEISFLINRKTSAKSIV
jgi:hypothetical protein